MPLAYRSSRNALSGFGFRRRRGVGRALDGQNLRHIAAAVGLACGALFGGEPLERGLCERRQPPRELADVSDDAAPLGPDAVRLDVETFEPTPGFGGDLARLSPGRL